MRKRNKLLILLVFFLLKFSVSFAQIDTSFWFATGWVTPDHWWKDDYKVHITGTAGTVVRLRQPAAIAPNKYDTTFTIPLGGIFNYTFWRDKIASATNFGFDSLEVRPANTVVPYGLYISSTANITVVFDYITRLPNSFNCETMSMKGQNGMGTEFLCPFQTIYQNKTLGGDLNGDAIVSQPKQQIPIVATQSNTTIWITPKCAVVGHPANITYSVFLPSAGSCYLVENVVQNTFVAGNNLGGSIVTSDKPICVNVHDDSANSTNGSQGCYDLMGDQIVPVDIIGSDYVVVRSATAPNGLNPQMLESAYIVGSQNFTQITINDGGPPVVVLINKGDTYRHQLAAPLTYITSTKPVYVIHASGFGCELGEAILPPLSCAGSSLVGFSRTSAQRFNLNILCKNGAQNTFTLNNGGGSANVPITAANFTLVPGTAGIQVSFPPNPVLFGYYGGQIPLPNVAPVGGLNVLPVGGYTVSNLTANTDVQNFALGVFDGDISSGGLYHYMSSFLRKTVVTTASMAPVCALPGNTVALTGTISGAANTGFWTTNGGGVIDPVYTSTLNTVSTVYTLSPGEAATISSLTITFSLTSNGCIPKTQTVSVIVNPPPVIIAAANPTTMCKNNLQPIVLTGSITNVLGAGAWTVIPATGGAFGVPGPNTTYTPSPVDLAAGGVTLTLNSNGPLSGCANTSTTVEVQFTPPPIVNAGSGTVVCTNSSSFTLNGNVSGQSNTGVWNTTGTGLFFPGSANPTATYVLSVGDLSLTTLVFTLTSTNNGNCSAVSQTIQVNIIPKPTVVTAPDFSLCANSLSTTLNGTVSGAGTTLGTWTTTNGSGAFNPLPPSGSTYTFSLAETLKDTVIVFVLNSSGGFCPPAADTLKIAILNPPSVTVAPNQTVCRNAPIALTATVTGFTNTGSWFTPGTGAFVPPGVVVGQYFPSAGDLINGTVVFNFTAGIATCKTTKSFTADFAPSPQANFNLSAIRCQNSPVGFTDASQANGTTLDWKWNFGEAPGVITIAQNPIYTFTTPGSYVITLTVTGTGSTAVCPDTVSRRITIYAIPTASFDALNACQGYGTQFTDASIVSTGNVTKWNWQFGDGGTDAIRNPIHTYTAAGSYFVVLQSTSNYSCVSSSFSKLVTVNPKPIAKFGMTNNPAVAQEPIYFSDFSAPSGGISKWLWTFGDEGSENSANPGHTYQDAGIYVITLKVFDNNNCSDSTSQNIEIQLLPQVPTAFSPNGDNNNDILFVKGGPFQSIIFKVYDNWGILLFETTDQKAGWDGKKNGKDQPIGTYVWTLQVDMYNNRSVKKNGDVTLIR